MPSLLHRSPTPARPRTVLPSAARADDLPASLLQLADADSDALADRLHDGALQALVVARYAADAVARGADPSLARDAVQEALVSLRRAVWLLRPRTTAGLPAALADLSAQCVAADLPALHLELDPTVGLGDAAAAVAYRLVQSVLEEAAGYRVRVRLSSTGDLAALDVDGTVADQTCWALRARALGGDLVAGPGRLRLLLPTTLREADS